MRNEPKTLNVESMVTSLSDYQIGTRGRKRQKIVKSFSGLFHTSGKSIESIKSSQVKYHKPAKKILSERSTEHFKILRSLKNCYPQ
jgi:hypothetical protein